MHAPVAIIN